MSAAILKFPKEHAAKAMLDRIEESLGNEPRSEYPPALLEKAIACLVDAAAERAEALGHTCDRQEAALMFRSWFKVKSDPAYVDRIKRAIAQDPSLSAQP